MNWEAINAIAQAIGAFGVVASLWYLGVQVHRSTRVAKIAAQDSAASALRDVTKPYMENAELARIWQVGLENLSALSPEDQSRFFPAFFSFSKRSRQFTLITLTVCLISNCGKAGANCFGITSFRRGCIAT